MGVQTWSVTARPCDSCAAAAATVFCRADSAFLCVTCDGRVHAAHTRHPRVWVCEVCEQAPSAVTCKADAAALCAACDADIHSANPLARRHERVPVVPFYDAVPASAKSASADECSEEEAEAASWLLPDPNSKPDGDSGSTRYKSPEYLFGEMDPNLDLDLHKSGHFSSDGVVPVQDPNEYGSGHYPGPVANGFPAYDLDYPGSKPFMYNFTSQSICKSMSSSSLDVGVVPDDNVMADETKNGGVPTRASGVDREAKVLRYKEKRKNRIFGKTIRYTSRKVYAETRPRIKGRFAKRSEREVDSLVVPTF